MYWNIDYKLKKKKLYDLIVAKNSSRFTIILSICILLDIIGIVLFLAHIILFRGETLDGKVAGILSGVLFLIIFIIISDGIRRNAILKLGSPYSEMEKEFIHLEKAGIEIGYHDILSKFSTSMVLYQIYYEDINNINYDTKLMILTITGVAKLTVYDDFQANRINHYLSQRRFYSDSEYSIILAFAEAEEIVAEINKKIEGLS